MKKTIKCSGCGAEYNLDLDKYGGKKIKCKQCEGIIVVPTIAQADDEFEVVEETPQPATPVAAPQSIVQRHRTASQTGAVNIALLQRKESSRDEIRRNFLAIHGSAESRLAGITTLVKERDQFVGKKQEVDDLLQRLTSGKAGKLDETVKLAQEIIGEPGKKSGGLLGGWSIFQNPLEQMAEIHEATAEQRKKTKGMSFLEKMKHQFTDEAAEDAVGFIKGMGKQDEAKKQAAVDAKVETVDKAIAVVTQEKNRLETEITTLTTRIDQTKAQLVQGCEGKLQAADAMIANGQLTEATGVLQGLVKEAPVEMLPPTLVGLSRCSFIAGNATDSARHIQEGVCFGAAAPTDMGSDYNNLWAKASAGLPSS